VIDTEADLITDQKLWMQREVLVNEASNLCLYINATQLPDVGAIISILSAVEEQPVVSLQPEGQNGKRNPEGPRNSAFQGMVIYGEHISSKPYPYLISGINQIEMLHTLVFQVCSDLRRRLEISGRKKTDFNT
jgi:hypothetical protein